ncbi:hypothetical protein [Paludibaculum fermentans]|uniref:Uncharacterized protein n=1 Tax=Paludibaculum fermentans TaxID=1473598 RepID=A0A7S7SNE9_PALFE|nr:hypothetical protein [Paludibaculum fermentans]QOY91389.1 hypothetical protein IRI77_15990 [Paludibaculum fermentans]
MPTIKILDNLSADLAVIAPTPASAFAKYLKGDLAILLAAPELVKAFPKPLAPGKNFALNFGLNFKDALEFGAAHTEWTVGASFQAQVGVTAETPSALFEQEHFGEPIMVPDGMAYVWCSFQPGLKLGIAAGEGDLSFGFNAGTAIDVRCCHLFPAGPAAKTLAEGVTEVLRDFTIPGDVQDLVHMPEGAVSAVTGTGSFQISGSFDLAAAVNPLATPKLPLVGAPLSLKAGASLDVGARIRVSGEYQIRAQKTSANKVRLGLYKRAGSQFTFDVNASAGVSADAMGKDLFSALMKKISSDPAADAQQLSDAGLSGSQIASIQDAVVAGINRSLSVALDFQFSALRSDEAAFLYEIALDQLSDESAVAVHHALDGDFSVLTGLQDLSMPGVTPVRNITNDLRKRGISLRINLLGIVNVISISELVRSGSVTFEPISGALVIADKVSSEKISVTSRPLEADGQKLRKAVFESLLVTAAYSASRLTQSHEFTASQSYFEFHQKTNARTMADNLDAIVALGLMTADERGRILAGATQFGNSTMLLETEFDPAAFRALFVSAGGQPRPMEDYERIGRDAMLALVAGDPDDFRHIPLGDDKLWAKLRASGQPGFPFVLPAPLNQGVQLGVIRSDYTLIVWWAGSMALAARSLVEMENFLKTVDPAGLHENNEFKKRRRNLIDALGDAVAGNQSTFGDPWGLLAMDAAAGRLADARAVVVSPQLARASMRPQKAVAANG